ncbi:MAG: TonB-dependent receptor [Phaeodactylibacter sp.]|nr:TonB-dependent receptor [Phaeodactylibacter sp.]MCB9273337.1 TonB-dependent receptor [Lewinellaceae bacterium]
MRWSVVLWFAFLCSCGPLRAQQALLQQPVSLKLEEATLAEALSALARDNKLNLSYSNTALPAERQYSYQFESVPLGVVLNILLRNTDIGYFESADYVVLRQASSQSPAAPALRFTLSGYVEDSRTGERLIGANVFLPAAGLGAITNTDGFFSLSLPADSLYIVVSYVGYETRLYRLGLFRNLRLDVAMLSNLELATVEITATPLLAELPFNASTSPGRQRLNAATIASTPSILGEEDLLQALALLPGVQSGVGNIGSINVRGAGPGHNHILLDGAQIYNPNHMLGLYSIFNASAVKDVELIKGAAPARYGGRLSSVLEVNGREGNFQQWGGEGSLGMIAGKAMVEGPIVKEKVSFLAAARRSYWDWLLSPLLRNPENGNRSGYYFGDLNAKIKFKPGGRDSWDASFYIGEDRLYINNRQDTSRGWRSTIYENGRAIELSEEKTVANLFWKNLASSLQWHRDWGGSVFSRTSLSYSDYRFQFDADISRKGVEEGGEPYAFASRGLYFSGVRTLALRADVDWAYRPGLRLLTGANVQGHQFRPQASGNFINALLFGATPGLSGQEGNLRPLELWAAESGLYAEAEWQWKRWQLGSGLHLAGFFHGRSAWASLQPRLRLHYSPSASWSYYTFFSINRQYAHLLGNDFINLPTDLWVPSTRRVEPQRSWQASAGLERRWPAGAFTVEGYYTYMSRLTALTPGIALGEESNWEALARQGEGHNYGMEALLRKTKGKWTGLLSYHLSWSWRQYEDINLGERYPYRNNRRHQLGAALNWRPTDGFSFSAAYNWLSGNYITVPTDYTATAYPPFGGEEEYSVGYQALSQEVNNYQTPNYHRLDICFDFIKHRGRYYRKWSLGVFNFYNRKNPVFYLTSQQENSLKLQGISLFPLIPSVSYHMKI